MWKNNMEDKLYSKWTNVRVGQTDANHFQWEIDSISRWNASLYLCVCWCRFSLYDWCVCVRQKQRMTQFGCCELVFETAIFNAYACVCNFVEYHAISFTFHGILYNSISVWYLLNRSYSHTYNHNELIRKRIEWRTNCRKMLTPI